MAKKKVNKIDKTELEELKKIIGVADEVRKRIGSLQIEISKSISLFSEVEAEIDKQRSELETKYGHVNVNLTTGEYEEIKEE